MKETPIQLRHALRLVHSLQKERGASASHYGYTVSHPDAAAPLTSPLPTTRPLSGIGASIEDSSQMAMNDEGTSPSQKGTKFWFDALVHARQGTDVAFHMILSQERRNLQIGQQQSVMTKQCSVWVDALQRVRNKIDDCSLFISSCNEPGGMSTKDININLSTHNDDNLIGPHRVIVMFNMFIGNVMDEIVIQVIHKEMNFIKQNYGFGKEESMSDRSRSKSKASLKSSLMVIQSAGEHHQATGIGGALGHSKHGRHFSQEFQVDTPSPEQLMRDRPFMLARSAPLKADLPLDTTHYGQYKPPDGLIGGCNLLEQSSSADVFDLLRVNRAVYPPGIINTSGHNSTVNTSKHGKNYCLTSPKVINGNEEGMEMDLHISTSFQAANEYTVPINTPSLLSPLKTEGPNSMEANIPYQMQEASSTPMKDVSTPSAIAKSPQQNRNARQIRDLLSLLLSFTQLKESTGVERSIVCSLMALSSDDSSKKGSSRFRTSHSTSKLFSDLVVEEENQRMIVRELQHQSKVLEISSASTSFSLLQMVEKFLRPGREMEDIHDMIKMFDLEGLQKSMKVKDFWPIITLYIDQLHALELLIIEELQLSREVLFWSRKDRSSAGVEDLQRSDGNGVHGSADGLNGDDDDDTNKAGTVFTNTSENDCISNSIDPNITAAPVNDRLITLSMSSHRSFDSKMDPKQTTLSNDVIFRLLQLDLDSNVSENDAINEMSKISADEIKKRLLQNFRGEMCPKSVMTPTNENNNSIDVLEQMKNPLTAKEPSHNLQEWEIDLYEIEFRQRIGRGIAGTTYLAKWSGQQVAVKVAAITDLGLEGWYTEVHSLKRLHHPNVIRLLGSIYNPSPQTYGLVLEYCNSGDLSEALHRQTPPNFFWKIADDVANGMSYLHRKSIMHRDIKPANILLDGDVAGGNFSAKVTDFGVAVLHSGPSEEHTAETGTYRWMAPEVIRHESYSFMADVYSYALVVWQLVTHETPFKDVSQIEAAGKVAIDDARPPFPPGTPNFVMVLIERCWSKWPDDRLSFAQITVELKEIHKELGEKDKSWLRDPEGHPVYDVKLLKKVPSKGSGGGRRSRGSSPSSKGKAKRRGSGSSCASTNKSGGLFSKFLRR